MLWKDGERQIATRGEVVKAFQNDPSYRMFIGTTQAGGVGITLTAASTVVFLDKMWTPADQSQAEDRLHRIGQKDNVYVINLLTKGTVEQHIERVLGEKQYMIQELMERAMRTYKPGAEILGTELTVAIQDAPGRLSIEATTRLLRRDA
jgi:SNF2 family DNA or RNA helicase